MKKAISYIRFSSSIQQYGDSLRRQARQINDWLEKHPEYELDDITYRDLGISAYNGTHATRGAFADFMEAVEQGCIIPGTVLLVESLDRLSREKIGEATDRLKNILLAGIEVVTLTDQTHYTISSLDDPYSLIKAILIAQRAYEESEIKSQRMRFAWQKKREEAAKTGKLITRSCPRWLKPDESGEHFVVINEYANSVNQVFKLRLRGHSLNAIAKTLNDKGVITLTGEYGVWNPSTIEKLLGNKAVIGTYTPSYRTMSKGVKEILNYFPSIISEKLFSEVQEIRLSPFGKDKTFDNPYLINIFRSIMRCKICGHSIIMTGITSTGTGYYVCPMRRLHRCDTPPIRRDLVDSYLINGVLAIANRINSVSDVQNMISLQERKIFDIHCKINHLIDALQVAPEVEALALKVKELNSNVTAEELLLKSLKSKSRDISSMSINSLDLEHKKDRERCRIFAGRHLNSINLDTRQKTCDLNLVSGLKIFNYPLYKEVVPDYLLNALPFADDGYLLL
ncbi:recombinase family protein [Citrobacter koseri]|uniref:recombinase family protein n=1 Tax=Citrobacter koseri TaxID=545 RepID=UPI003892C787